MTPQQIIDALKTQQEQLQQGAKRIQELEHIINSLQMHLTQKTEENKVLQIQVSELQSKESKV
jgi:regulator of replication initiation timing